MFIFSLKKKLCVACLC